MKYHFAILIVTLSLFLPTFSFAKPVRFGPLPMRGESYVREEFYPFIQYLEEILQRPVEFAYRDDNRGVIDGLSNDEIDLAFLGPLPYAVLSQKDSKILPLLQFLNADGSSGYTCSVGIFSGTDLTIHDLKGKAFALTQPYSTCGYLMTECMLNHQGVSLENNSYEFIGSHPDVALAVIEGKVDVCGIKTSIGQQYASLGLTLLKESSRVPSFILVANSRTLKQDEISRVRDRLLALAPLVKKEDATLTQNWGELIKYGAAPVGENEFQVIIDLLKHIKVPGVNQ
jgi:phosphonate transport system substrate-binding protein